MGNIWNGFVVALEETLKFFWQITGQDAALAILLFTIAAKVILLPLTIGQLRSMREMQKLQPKVRELQSRYKKDRQKLNEELMKLYREHGVNPAAGCLPSLLQIPIFFGVYFAILNLTRPLGLGTLLGRWVGFASAEYLGLGAIPADIQAGLSHGILAHQAVLWMESLGKPDPLHILPILAGILQFVQQKMMTPRDADPQQAAMNNAMLFMPLMIVFFGWTFPAGPVLYWVIQSFLGIIQQYLTSGWGSLKNWLPFLPERKVSERPRRVSRRVSPEERPRGRFARWMDRVLTLPEEAAPKESLIGSEGGRTETPPVPPPVPRKRRSSR